MNLLSLSKKKPLQDKSSEYKAIKHHKVTMRMQKFTFLVFHLAHLLKGNSVTL